MLDVVAALANAAVERGGRCSVVHGRRPETPSALDGVFDSRIRLVEVPGWGSRGGAGTFAEVARAASAIRRELARYESGVLHLHSSFAGVVGRLVAPLRGWKVFYTPHAYGFLNASLPPAVRAAAFLLEHALARRGSTIAVSRAEGEVAARLAGRRRVAIITNGVDLPPPRPLPPDDTPFTVVSIGRATYQRRADLVARVAARLRSELTCRFVWIGDGPDRGVLGAAGVAVEGWLPREAARERLAAAHVVLHLAAFEGLPLAVLEAMAANRPVVASRLPPLREAVGDAGFLVADEGEAVAALRKLAGDPALRAGVAARGRERVARLFSRRAMVERTFAAYGFDDARAAPARPGGNAVAR